MAVLGWSGGGSGYFESLIAVINKEGNITASAGFELGDRVNINSIKIKNRVITVDMLTQGPNDPRCCPTERHVINLFVDTTNNKPTLKVLDKNPQPSVPPVPPKADAHEPVALAAASTKNDRKTLDLSQPIETKYSAFVCPAWIDFNAFLEEFIENAGPALFGETKPDDLGCRKYHGGLPVINVRRVDDWIYTAEILGHEVWTTDLGMTNVPQRNRAAIQASDPPSVSAPEPSAEPNANGLHRIGGGVSAAVPIVSPEAEFSEQARRANACPASLMDTPMLSVPPGRNPSGMILRPVHIAATCCGPPKIGSAFPVCAIPTPQPRSLMWATRLLAPGARVPRSSSTPCCQR